MVIRRFRPKSGDTPAGQFEQLIEPHLQHLYQLAYRFSNNQTDAEDLVQDVVVKLLPRSKEMAQIEKLRPWLAKVLYRQFIDRYRQHERSPLSLVTEGDDTLSQHPDPSGETPETRTEADLTQKRLTMALLTLNEDQRAVVLLHDVEGYTLSELESILDSPQGTLKSRLNRARTQLREHLQKSEQ